MNIATIVIPTYKRADRIKRAVDSALNQSYEDIEIIVVDDNGKNSDDAKQTQQVLQPYIDNNSIIYLQNEKNSGGSFARNQGLNIAKGKYITFLDDDDEISKNKIEKQVECLEELDSTYSCVYTAYHKIMANNKIQYSAETIQGNVYKHALSRSVYVGSGSNLLVKTQVAKEIGGYNIQFKRNQDLEFMTRLLKDHKLAYVDEDLMTIHYEIRELKQSYQDLINIDDFYYQSFKADIKHLTNKDQKDIKSIIALERFRYSINRNINDGITNLFRNKVALYTFIRYICYIFDRAINKKSYGFKIK